LGTSHKAWCGNTAVTAGTTPGRQHGFLGAQRCGRFHFAGGARFVHGSAMPQEIVVPVITVKRKRIRKAKTRQVEFSLLGSSNKVVTNKQRFEFIQTEPVSEQHLRPDGRAQALGDPDHQVRQLRQDQRPFPDCPGRQTKVEVIRIPLKVDLAFANDF
jgi:hypothetical protein